MGRSPSLGERLDGAGATPAERELAARAVCAQRTAWSTAKSTRADVTDFVENPHGVKVAIKYKFRGDQAQPVKLNMVRKDGEPARTQHSTPSMSLVYFFTACGLREELAKLCTKYCTPPGL